MSKEALIDEFKSLADPPSIEHPWFQGIITGTYTEEQILAGEIQHYLRGRQNFKIFGLIAMNAKDENDEELIELTFANVKDEVFEGKPHDELMYQFMEERGISRLVAANAKPTSGTKEAIAMLTTFPRFKSALEGVAMMSLPEWQNATNSAAVYESFRNLYGFSEYSSVTYKVHSTVDIEHGDNQLELLAQRVMDEPDIKHRILRAMEYGVRSFNREWDGHHQAATGELDFHWRG